MPGGLVVRTLLPLRGARVQSLVGALTSHMPSGKKKKIIIKWRLANFKGKKKGTLCILNLRVKLTLNAMTADSE